MPDTKPGESREEMGGINVDSALHDFCGLLLVEKESQRLTPTNVAARVLGLESGSVSISDLPEPVRRAVDEAMSTGTAIIDREQEIQTSAAGTKSISLTLLPAQSAAKTMTVAVMVKDVSAIKKLDQDIRRLDRLATIGTLSASMAHEIKNALVAIKTFIDLLIEKHADTDMAPVVQRELSRIDSIVSQILKFSGPARPVLSSVRMHEILEHSLRLVGPQLKGKSILITRGFDAQPDLVQADDHQLEQAFVNLLLNSLEAMGPDGKLSIATELFTPESSGPARNGAFPKQILVTITDTGSGIPSENMARLFEPFFTTKPGGTGLGLAITRRIIEEHKGKINFQSQLNKGSVFQVSFPAAG